MDYHTARCPSCEVECEITLRGCSVPRSTMPTTGSVALGSGIYGAGISNLSTLSHRPPSLLLVAETAIVFILVASRLHVQIFVAGHEKGLVNMRLPWRKRESESSADSVALVVIELPADELLVEEPAIEELQAEPRGTARLLARSRRLARRLNPAGPARIALGTSGQAAKSVVVKLHPRRLAGAVREFRGIGSADLARLAHGVGRGTKGVDGRLGLISPRKARSVRVVTTVLRRMVKGISPSAATRVARETTELARTTIAKLDPRQVEDAVRGVAATIDSDGKVKVDKAGRGTRLDKIARAAVIKIGPERAVRIAAEATRALKRLVDGLDPDHVGRAIGEFVAAARSANDKKGRLRVVGFLASLVGEVGRALKSVAKDIECREVVVVLLVVVTTAPELLIAAGVSVAVLRVLRPLLHVLVQVLPDRGSRPTSGRVPQSSS